MFLHLSNSLKHSCDVKKIRRKRKPDGAKASCQKKFLAERQLQCAAHVPFLGRKFLLSSYVVEPK
jgi:hypothetical protein